MRVSLLCAAALLAASTGLLCADEPSAFDFKKFSTEFQSARSKALNAEKVPPGEQPAFETLQPYFERWAKGLGDLDADSAKTARSSLLNYLTLYPTSSRARAMIDEVIKPLSDAEKASVRVSQSRSLLRDSGHPRYSPQEAARMTAEAEELLTMALKDGDERTRSQVTNLQYVARNLAVGKPAPEAICHDLDGKEVKLSDYRGKIVVLDFWFTGCFPCRMMIPHQRELVARLKDKPFALVSISADSNKDDLTAFLKDTPMPWTHWHSGRKDGIVADWKVNSFPTIYVLDARGTIRFKEVRETSLDKAVDLLLAEMADTAPPKTESKATDRPAQYQAIQKEITEARRKAMTIIQNGGTAEEQTVAWKTYSDLSPFAPRLLDLVNADPKDDVAFDALVFLATTGPDQEWTAEAFDLLARHHATSGKLAPMLGKATILRPAAQSFLEQVLTTNPERDLKTKAAMALAQIHIQAAERSATSEGAASSDRKAAGVLQKIIDDFADFKLGPKEGTAGDWAKKYLAEVRDLGIGQPFPDLEGMKLDGSTQRVSDHKGKVVVFDVWATWCGPCRAMIPHERELVERMKDKPFELISVSADDDKETLEKFLQSNAMPWTHWWSGGHTGTMLKALHIRHFPTIYVLDAKGVIRYKGVRGEKMDAAVDALLAEIK